MALSMAAFGLNSWRLHYGSAADSHQKRFWGRKSLIPASMKLQNSSLSCPPIKYFSPPWMMLPPSWDDDTSSVGFNFYYLGDNNVITLPQTEGLKHLIPRDLRICGSSHGWIALINPHTLDLFIYNPVTLRHIMLPSIRNLPNYPKHNQKLVTKLILSCSPEDRRGTCCAVMIYNSIDGLAFCYPGLSSEWTTFGRNSPSLVDDDVMVGCGYTDFVYSRKQNLYFGINYSHELETWDLTDPSSPRMINMIDIYDDKYLDPLLPSMYEGWPVQPKSFEYLVVVEDDVLLVTRHVVSEVTPDGSYDYQDMNMNITSIKDFHNLFRLMRKRSDLYPKFSDFYPSMTIGFHIDLYHPKGNELITGLQRFDDLALFIGSCSDSVAVSTTRCGYLKSNSIYFTDQDMEFGYSDDEFFAGHDIGIFDFENKTVSPYYYPCYYPCDSPNLKRIVPSPIWYFPRS